MAARDDCVVARDGCVVETAPLAEVLSGFVQRWNRDRPPLNSGRFAPGQTRTEVTTVSAYEYLAQETQLGTRVIERIAKNRSKLTELRVADALVTAIERPEVFVDGTLTVMENPFAKASERAKCCGGSSSDGSLTGVVEPF